MRDVALVIFLPFQPFALPLLEGELYSVRFVNFWGLKLGLRRIMAPLNLSNRRGQSSEFSDNTDDYSNTINDNDSCSDMQIMIITMIMIM